MPKPSVLRCTLLSLSFTLSAAGLGATPLESVGVAESAAEPTASDASDPIGSATVRAPDLRRWPILAAAANGSDAAVLQLLRSRSVRYRRRPLVDQLNASDLQAALEVSCRNGSTAGCSAVYSLLLHESVLHEGESGTGMLAPTGPRMRQRAESFLALGDENAGRRCARGESEYCRVQQALRRDHPWLLESAARGRALARIRPRPDLDEARAAQEVARRAREGAERACDAATSGDAPGDANPCGDAARLLERELNSAEHPEVQRRRAQSYALLRNRCVATPGRACVDAVRELDRLPTRNTLLPERRRLLELAWTRAALVEAFNLLYPHLRDR